MKYYTSTTQFNCGIDLHARQMYVCVMDRDGHKLGTQRRDLHFAGQLPPAWHQPIRLFEGFVHTLACG
jgi:hypothetical protein